MIPPERAQRPHHPTSVKIVRFGWVRAVEERGVERENSAGVQSLSNLLEQFEFVVDVVDGVAVDNRVDLFVDGRCQVLDFGVHEPYDSFFAVAEFFDGGFERCGGMIDGVDDGLFGARNPVENQLRDTAGAATEVDNLMLVEDPRHVDELRVDFAVKRLRRKLVKSVFVGLMFGLRTWHSNLNVTKGFLGEVSLGMGHPRF